MADGRGIEGTDGFRMVVGVSCVGWYGWGMGYRYLTSGTCASPTNCKNALYTAIPVVNYIGISTQAPGGKDRGLLSTPTNKPSHRRCMQHHHNPPQCTVWGNTHHYNPPFGGQRGQPPPFTTTHHQAPPCSVAVESCALHTKCQSLSRICRP